MSSATPAPSAAAAAAAAAAPVVVAGSNNAYSPATNTFLALSSGAFAGALSRTITSPLERLKVMKQVQATGNAYKGIIGALVKMAKEEGIASYWKGNGTNVARIAPFSAIQFWSFDVYRRWIIGEDTKQAGFVRTFSAGALTGITASTICYPLDLVRSVLSVQTTQTHYNGIMHAMATIVRTDGFFGLYRGIAPTLMGIAPYVAINMTTFDMLKNIYLPDRSHPNFTLINLSLGACAGFVAAGITYPTDVIRRRMQLQGMKGVDLPKYDNTFHCIQSIVKAEGINGLYKGMIPCFLKVVPSMAIAFTTYELLRKQLKFDPPSSKPPSAG